MADPTAPGLGYMRGAAGEWVMPLGGDEIVGEALAGRLPELLTRRDLRQVWAPRRWVYGDCAHVLDRPP